jgi:hypothetical protein
MKKNLIRFAGQCRSNKMAKWNFNEVDFNALQAERDALKLQVEELKSEHEATIIRMEEMSKNIQNLESRAETISETSIWAVGAIAQKPGVVGFRIVQVACDSEKEAMEYGMKKIQGMNLGYKIHSPDVLRIVVDKT